MDKIFKIPSQLVKIQRGDKFIFINPNMPKWIVTDAVGSLFVELFNGKNTISEIVDIAVLGLGESQRDRVMSFCKKVYESGILNDVSCKHKCHKYQLSSVHLSLSDSCNLKCVYCYASKRVENNFNYLTFNDYIKIIDEILTINKHIAFTLTGGEPLLNKDCFKIAEYIKNKGAKVFLLTNGILINESNISIIASLFDLVTISIDGPNSIVHSLTRGDNFNLVINAKNLLELYKVEYTLSMTVTKQNIKYISQMAKMFGNHLNFAPYFPIQGDVSALSISGLEYFRALKDAHGVNPLSYCERSLNNAINSPCYKCSIGDGEFSISATGDVYPCQLLHVDSFWAGNIHTQSIVDIYNKSDVFKQMSSMEVDNIEGCNKCPIKYICGGSCRARAFYEGGNIKSNSDFCKYEQESFYDGIISLYSLNGV